MISYENGVFSLNGEGFTYMFRVSKHGQLEHLHFGAPVMAADAGNIHKGTIISRTSAKLSNFLMVSLLDFFQWAKIL